MQSKNKIWLILSWVAYGLFLFITFIVPAFSLTRVSSPGATTVSTTETMSLFDLFAVGSINLSSSATVGFNYFNSLLISCAFIAPVALSLSKNKICKFLALGLSLVLFAFTLQYVNGASEFQEKSVKQYDCSYVGIIMIFISSIMSTFITGADIFVTYYLKDLARINNVSVNVMDQLEENKQMFDKGLITEEEYAARRSKILGE